MKEVTVGLTMSSSFIRLLNAKVQLAGLREKDELDPAGVLALVILAETRGGLEPEVDALIPPEHREDFRVEHSMRKVVEL